jgi:hypothetical protein
LIRLAQRDALKFSSNSTDGHLSLQDAVQIDAGERDVLPFQCL